MDRFQDILVGVDLSQGDRWVSPDLSPPTEEAVKRACWIARLNSARLTYLYAIDISFAAQRLVEQDSCVVAEAKDILCRLASQARAEGVAADHAVRFGKSWIEIIRRVLQHRHDLVVAGTRHLGATKSFFVGSTGVKLLRKCPCPVWITQPQQHIDIKTILVAHDLRPVGESAMALGCSLARLHGATLHVLHALNPSALGGGHSASSETPWGEMTRVDAERRILAQANEYDLEPPPLVHVVATPADEAILRTIEEYDIELVVMGTVGRSGIAGFITGNTAERLLPQIPCSVLAVKPTGFASPVTLAS